MHLNLRKLILFSTILSVSCLFVVSIFILNYIIKEQLTDNSLSVNAKYAAKIAQSTDRDIQNMLLELDYSAKELSTNFNDSNYRNRIVHRLKNQSHYFNSVFILDKNQYGLAFSPNTLNFKTNQPYHSFGIDKSAEIKKTFISKPYLSVRNNLVVMMSQPIFDQQGQYLGFIGGSIYLQKKNIISEMLLTQFDFKKSYMYVIDSENRIIFHPNDQRIGETIVNNTGLNYINQHKNGSIKLVNSLGVENLAGFAHIPNVNWTVISQQPTEELLEQANYLIFKVSVGIFIFYLFIFFLVWRVSRFISSPINQLAKMASMLNNKDIQQKINQVDPWYFEVYKFRTSLLISSTTFNNKIIELKHHINIDPLTGLYNRRGMQYFLDDLKNTETPFTVLVIDIDFFKRINDTYGHSYGDEILKKLAKTLQESFRDLDLCCRVGGEEFVVLMTATDLAVGVNAAKRFKDSIEYMSQTNHHSITVSIGIAHWPTDALNIDEVFKKADEKLYEAKHKGRNRICTTQNFPDIN